MSYKDAIENGVRVKKENGRNFYFVPCKHCGNEVKTPYYDPSKNYSCRLCKLMTDSETKKEVTAESKERKFENAIKRIAEVANLNDYEDAMSKIRKCLHREGWFSSTEEIMVAIELLKCGYKINHQVPIKRYKLDFVLKEQKLILEVDGYLYHTEKTKPKEQLRDDIAIASFGADWEVLRVSTLEINKNITRLSKAIEASIERRRKYREGLNGQLPDWYNDREKYSDDKRLTAPVKVRVLKENDI